MRSSAASAPIGQSIKAEPLVVQALRAASESLRQQANLLDALALANASGNNADLLKPSAVQRLINCGESKARQIVRAHGIGQGKMGRIERGVLMELQRSGKL
jgi:hypothetical protein